MTKAKPFEISKRQVWEAYQRVKANKGAAGVDDQTISEFDQDMENNLYRLWNRMSSGSYFPSATLAVPIAKKSGGTRILGIPTIADRIGQTVVTQLLEPILEPVFHDDSYGYRPGRSAHHALEVTRKRCWEYDWVLEYDIRGLFDNIDHDMLLKALRHHTDNKWVLLYVRRWLTAPMQQRDGTLIERLRGAPQGGPLSPVLANLFLHYALDHWLATHHAEVPFCRYADDGVIHCASQEQALSLREQISDRLKACKLELHPEKTRIVYCKDANRPGEHDEIQFDFLGYTFKPRESKNRYDRMFLNFCPAVSGASLREIRQKIRGWRLHRKSQHSLEDLARLIAPEVRGWMAYYCRFGASEFQKIANHLDRVLVRWAMRKFKRLRRHAKRARHWLGKIKRLKPDLFVHWSGAGAFRVRSLGAQ